MPKLKASLMNPEAMKYFKGMPLEEQRKLVREDLGGYGVDAGGLPDSELDKILASYTSGFPTAIHSDKTTTIPAKMMAGAYDPLAEIAGSVIGGGVAGGAVRKALPYVSKAVTSGTPEVVARIFGSGLGGATPAAVTGDIEKAKMDALIGAGAEALIPGLKVVAHTASPMRRWIIKSLRKSGNVETEAVELSQMLKDIAAPLAQNLREAGNDKMAVMLENNVGLPLSKMVDPSKSTAGWVTGIGESIGRSSVGGAKRFQQKNEANEIVYEQMWDDMLNSFAGESSFEDIGKIVKNALGKKAGKEIGEIEAQLAAKGRGIPDIGEKAKGFIDEQKTAFEAIAKTKYDDLGKDIAAIQENFIKYDQSGNVIAPDSPALIDISEITKKGKGRNITYVTESIEDVKARIDLEVANKTGGIFQTQEALSEYMGKAKKLPDEGDIRIPVSSENIATALMKKYEYVDYEGLSKIRSELLRLKRQTVRANPNDAGLPTINEYIARTHGMMDRLTERFGGDIRKKWLDTNAWYKEGITPYNEKSVVNLLKREPNMAGKILVETPDMDLLANLRKVFSPEQYAEVKAGYTDSIMKKLPKSPEGYLEIGKAYKILKKNEKVMTDVLGEADYKVMRNLLETNKDKYTAFYKLMGKSKPEDVVKSFLGEKDTSILREIFGNVDEGTKNIIRRGVLDDILSKSRKISGDPGNRIIYFGDELVQRLDKHKDKLKLMYSPGNVEQITKMAKVMQIDQSNNPIAFARMAIAMQQANTPAQAINMVTSISRGDIAGVSKASAFIYSILMIPGMAAKFLTHKDAAKWLMNGYRAKPGSTLEKTSYGKLMGFINATLKGSLYYVDKRRRTVTQETPYGIEGWQEETYSGY